MLGAGVAAGNLGCGEAGVDVGLFGEGVGLPGGGFGVQGGPTAGAEDEGFVDDTLVWFPRGGLGCRLSSWWCRC